MKVARTEADLSTKAIHRPRSQGGVRRRCGVSSSVISNGRAISRSRCWATAEATPSISASATVRCSGAPESLGGRPLPGDQWQRARPDRRDRRQGDARSQLSRCRHGRISIRGRCVLFHRDEHAHPGRASGDRNDHQHRSHPRADPRRRRRRAHAHARRHQIPRPRHRMPHQCREPGVVSPVAGKILLPSAGRLGVRVDSAGIYQACDPRRTTICWWQADRPRQDARRVLCACGARSTRSWWTGSRPRCLVPRWCASRTSPTATTTSTG